MPIVCCILHWNSEGNFEQPLICITHTNGHHPACTPPIHSISPNASSKILTFAPNIFVKKQLLMLTACLVKSGKSAISSNRRKTFCCWREFLEFIVFANCNQVESSQIKSSKNRCWRKSIIIGRWEILDSLIRKSSKWKSLSCIKLNLKYEVFTERSKRPFNAHRRNTYIGHAVSILVSEYVLYLWYIWFWTWIYFLVNRQIYFIPVFTYVCLPPGFKVYPVSFIYLLI